MNDLFLSNKVQEEFARSFESIAIDHRSVEVGSGTAHAFFLTYCNVLDVESTWRQVSNFIALNCQTTIADDFGRWNTYLFFLVDGKLNVSVKYKIENDTFSSRKIVVQDREFDRESIINSHILNSDLEFSLRDEDTKQYFLPNEVLWELLNAKVLKIKKRTAAADETFNQLLRLLKPGDEV